MQRSLLLGCFAGALVLAGAWAGCATGGVEGSDASNGTDSTSTGDGPNGKDSNVIGDATTDGGGCPSNETACSSEGGAVCVDTKTDNAHCGSCATQCLSQLEYCDAGGCSSACTGGKILCIPDGGPPDPDAGDAGAPVAHCANTQTDDTDCNACFKVCPLGAHCTAGVCKIVITGSGTANSPWTSTPPLANCAAYLTAAPASTDGIYTIHPLATDINVYCDMTHNGLTYEDFGFGQFTAAYTGWTFVGSSDFKNAAQFDAAFSFIYTRNGGGLTNISPNSFSVSNCCIEDTTANTRYGLGGGTYMQPAMGNAVNCAVMYAYALVPLYLEPNGPVKTSFTAAEASQTATTTTCSVGGNPGIFVKRY